MTTISSYPRRISRYSTETIRFDPLRIPRAADLTHTAPFSASYTHANYVLSYPLRSQLFKAADNSCLAAVPHGSRINRACFTTVAGAKGGAAQWRIATVCDNKSVNLFDFEGKQVRL